MSESRNLDCLSLLVYSNTSSLKLQTLLFLFFSKIWTSKLGYIDSPFFDQQLQQPSTYQNMVNNKGIYVCRNCGTVNGYDIASEYVDFHENKYKIVKKSVYQRKYHLENVINNICI